MKRTARRRLEGVGWRLLGVALILGAVGGAWVMFQIEAWDGFGDAEVGIWIGPIPMSIEALAFLGLVGALWASFAAGLRLLLDLH